MQDHHGFFSPPHRGPQLSPAEVQGLRQQQHDRLASEPWWRFWPRESAPITPLDLFQAIAHRDDTTLAVLLGRGEKPCQWATLGPDLLGQPLHFASWRMQPEAVRLLLEAGADPNLGLLSAVPDPSGWTSHLEGYTPLMLALWEPTVARLLLRHGADPNARSGAGFTCLGVAIHNAPEAAVHLLVQHGVKLSVETRTGLPSDLARQIGRDELAAYLLREEQSRGIERASIARERRQREAVLEQARARVVEARLGQLAGQARTAYALEAWPELEALLIQIRQLDALHEEAWVIEILALRKRGRWDEAERELRLLAPRLMSSGKAGLVRQLARRHRAP